MTKEEVKKIIDSLTMEYHIIGIVGNEPFQGRKRLVDPAIIKPFIDMIEMAK